MLVAMLVATLVGRRRRWRNRRRWSGQRGLQTAGGRRVRSCARVRTKTEHTKKCPTSSSRPAAHSSPVPPPAALGLCSGWRCWGRAISHHLDPCKIYGCVKRTNSHPTTLQAHLQLGLRRRRGEKVAAAEVPTLAAHVPDAASGCDHLQHAWPNGCPNKTAILSGPCTG